MSVKVGFWFKDTSMYRGGIHIGWVFLPCRNVYIRKA